MAEKLWLRKRSRKLALLIALAAALALLVPAALAIDAVFSGAITLSDPTQTPRMFRDAVASTCAAPKTFPGTTGSGSFHYDLYSFKNSTATTQCVTVSLDAMTCTGANPNIFSAAYSPSFNPASIGTNYLADAGSSPSPTGSYSFNVPAGANYHVNVHEVTNDAGCPAYSLTVSQLSPTAARLLSFSAARAVGGVALRWRTGSEAGTLGYNLYREQAGKRVRVNPKLIPAARRAGIHIYSWLDRKATAETKRYLLQHVSLDGQRRWEAAARVAA